MKKKNIDHQNAKNGRNISNGKDETKRRSASLEKHGRARDIPRSHLLKQQ